MVSSFKIPVKPSELRLDLTLQSGQCFRWTEVKPKKWRSVIKNRIWTLTQNDNSLNCEVQEKTSPEIEADKQIKTPVPELKRIIKEYFRLDVNLSELYKQWAKADPSFAKISKDFEGIRILNQDPVENIFSFICSSNNNIERITKLVNHLCREFGSLIGSLDEQEWYSFPSIQDLALHGREGKLRTLGFGYRAKYIQNSAKSILEKGGEKWLHDLQTLDYRSCHSKILVLSGVGPKVADCICLMSMNHLESIPVDTHVLQIASRDYLPHLRGKKSLTEKVYNEIGDHFRSLFGPYAGWAHSVLFTADLRKFKKPLVEKQKPNKRKINDD